MTLCCCLGLTNEDIERWIDVGCRTVGEIAAASGAGADCGGCCQGIEALLRARQQVVALQELTAPREVDADVQAPTRQVRSA